MPSKIKQFNFNGCQHLRKLLIDNQVEFTGKIDLSDTPLQTKNDVYAVDIKFANIPDGITATPDILKNRIKLETETAEMETQTDPEITGLGDLQLTEDDKKAMELMYDNLFWWNYSIF